jgi:hypothetical protein
MHECGKDGHDETTTLSTTALVLLLFEIETQKYL